MRTRRHGAGGVLVLQRVLSVALVVGWGAGFVWGAERTSSESVSVDKTEDRLHFKLPPDWPIEKRGGVVGPIPLEEYLARKFNTIESRLQVLEQRFNGIDVRLRVLEEEKKQRQSGLRSSEQGSSGGAQTEVTGQR